LNRDFRYQLTVLGTFAIVAKEIKSNRFVVQTDAPNVKVSWQVAGVRSDPTARKFKFEVEEEKDRARARPLSQSDAYGQPEENRSTGRATRKAGSNSASGGLKPSRCGRSSRIKR